MDTTTTERGSVRAERPRLTGADARRFAGKWVVLRDGRVVTSSRSRWWVERHKSGRDVVSKVPSSDTLVV